MRWTLAVALLLAACGDDDTSEGADASPDEGAGAGGVCRSNSDCDDGVFCNGSEICQPGTERAAPNGCVSGERPCSGNCDEAGAVCTMACQDADGDGFESASCGGSDCDDSDRNRFPGNSEICDASGMDEDCDDRTVGFRDADMDGSNDQLCCNGENCGPDCNDMSPSVHAAAPEVCDNLDNDCDGNIDEGVQLTWFPDADGDGFGAEGAMAVVACAPPLNHVLDASDCDDANRQVNPVAFDVCDGAIDHDCNGVVDDPPLGCDCSDREMRSCSLKGVCESATQTCMGGTWSSCSIAPSPEECDGQDDDCDGAVDEMLGTQTVFRDADGDGFGDADTSLVTCDAPPGYVLDDRDCADDLPGVNPSVSEFFGTDRGDGSFDHNCDGVEQRELDLSGFCRRSPMGDRCVSRNGWVGLALCGETVTRIVGCNESSSGGSVACASVTEATLVRCR